MGKNNRTRRAAKVRARSRASRTPPPRRDGASPRPEPVCTASDAVAMALHAARVGDTVAFEYALGVLASAPVDAIAVELGERLDALVARAWERGWQPVDLVGCVDRHLGRSEGDLVRRAIASDAARYEDLGRRVAPHWMAQVDEVGVADRALRSPYLVRPGGDWSVTLTAAVRLAGTLTDLPTLPRLVDPPSAWRSGMRADGASLPRPVLDKVRALLAKAESTTFDAEAEAFTAKAQELMTRYRIDRAMLGRDGARGDDPIGRRIVIDDPYADARATLLDQVARANGCRTAWSKDLGFSTVFGFGAELDAVEELFTSLLVQATAALRRAGSKQDQFGRSRTTRFRRTFLVAFAMRIGQRLQAAVDEVVEHASGAAGTDVVPLLSARTDAVDTAVSGAFPGLRAFRPSTSDAEGWYAGRVFADQADLSISARLPAAG